MPPNARVIEFFFEPGSLLNSPHAQSHYLSANYTHVARELLHRGVNVIAHVVARRMAGGTLEISLGSNPDVTVDLLPDVARAARRRAAGGDARPGASRDALHARRRARRRRHLRSAARSFALRLRPVRAAESGAGAPWITPSACTPAAWCATPARCRSASANSAIPSSIRCCCATSRTRPGAARCSDVGTERSAALIDAIGGRAPFSTGLFGATEMFVDQMLDLYRAGILRRRVYDYLPLQRALAANGSSTRVDAALLEGLLAAGAGPRLGAQDFAALRAAGVLRSECRFEDGSIVSPDGVRIDADLGNPKVARGAGRRMPGPRAQGRHRDARRIPAGPARLLRGAERAAGIRAAPVRHARRGLHQPALRRRSGRCASPSAATRAS